MKVDLNIVKLSSIKNKPIFNRLNISNSHTYSTSPLRTKSDFAYNFSCVNFLGNINHRTDFEKTLDYNYFRLPCVTLDDGREYQIKPDKAQVECAEALYENNSVIFEASTGAGKTAVAHYAVNKNLYNNKKTIITVPLISLANDKYREFCKIYGAENVGLLTGVKKVNVDAPITIMVTEILRNQTADLKDKADEIGTIVFDEAHFIANEDRGAAWENSIIAAAKSNIQILCLSATLGNGEDFSAWVQSLNPARETSRVVMDFNERVVPLKYMIYKPDEEKGASFLSIIKGQVDLSVIDENNLSNKQKRALSEIFISTNNKNEFYELNDEEYIATFRNLKIKTNGDERFFYEYQFKDELMEKFPSLNKHQAQKISELLLENKWVDRVTVPVLERNNYAALVRDLQKEDMIPALIFKLSQRGCDNIADYLIAGGLDLTTDEEKVKIKEVIDEYFAQGASLGDNFGEDALLKGFGVHHAGKLPDYQKLVEELFSKKLIKVVSATSTLSAGINMPVRTVVMTDVNYAKYNPKTHSLEKTQLTPSEFHQMIGRAGRRGIDSVGYVVLYNIGSKKHIKNKDSKNMAPNNLKVAYDLIEAKPNNLQSVFKPEPCMLAQYYYENKTNENIERLVSDSFKVFLAKSNSGKTKDLLHSFRSYSNILKNLCYLKKDNEKLTLTPKGELLRVSMGANPLMVSTLVYEQRLQSVKPENLAQIAGYISNTNKQREEKDLYFAVLEKLEGVLEKAPRKKELMTYYRNTDAMYKAKEDKVINSMIDAGLNPDEIETADSFGALCVYLFAYLNKTNPNNGRENFNLLVNEILRPIPCSGEKGRIEFNRKATNGKIYKTIAQSISVLEQIERLCDHALLNEELFPNQKYYSDLKNKTMEAIKLIKTEPFDDVGGDYEN